MGRDMEKAKEMSQGKAYVVGFVSGLATIAALLLPVLALTGWEQSPASAIALVVGIAAAVGVNAWLVTQVEAEDAPEASKRVSRPLIAAHR